MADTTHAKGRPVVALTPGSKIRLRSAGGDDEALMSVGLFRGLVSVGGDNCVALELEEGSKEEKGRIRLVPMNAILAVDVVEAAKPEEEKRAEPTASPGYFR